MKKPSQLDSEHSRRKHNSDLIRRMKNGESLCSFDSVSSWFPPRPTIDKDPEAIKELYGESKASKKRTPEKPDSDVVVLHRDEGSDESPHYDNVS